MVFIVVIQEKGKELRPYVIKAERYYKCQDSLLHAILAPLKITPCV